MITLHGFFRSSSTHRCRIALNLKGINYRTEPVNLRAGGNQTADFGNLNPQQAVPVLVSGEVVITQSLAIMEWLEEKYPQPALLPTDPDRRAAVRAASQLFACDIQPLHNLRVLNHLRSRFDSSEDEVRHWCAHWIQTGLSAFERLVSQQGGGSQYAFSATPGLADVCLAPQLFAAERFTVELSGWPEIQRLEQLYASHPAFLKAEPAQQPDAAAS